MITDTTSLAEWRARAQRQPKGRAVLDLEADSLHRHREKLCLIQYGDEEGETIIDPLVIEDMRLFSQWLEGAEVWMHGADYDMTLLQRAYGILPAMIWDTQIAARLLGFRQFGLAALVEHYYGVVMSKKNQKADWGRRPMPPDMLEYAQGDVKYILSMADTMVEALREKGRYEWFVESCEHHLQRGRERYGETHEEPWRIKGCGKLNRRGLAALRALWTWRDAEAAEWDRPSFMVCGNEHLLRWSQALQEFRPVTPLHSFHSHRAARFNRAVEQFQLLDEDEYPMRPQREHREVDAHFEERVEALIARRNSVAEELDIEPSLIASRVQIEAIAADREAGMSRLMHWQQELLA